MNYLEEHKKSGLKVGDRVKVCCVAADYEQGWKNVWAGEMSRKVGKILTIERDSGANGFRMSDGFWYPYFVLEKVPLKSLKIKIGTKRTRAGLKVPCYTVMFSGINKRTVVESVFTYGRNGDSFDNVDAFHLANTRASELDYLQAWVERGFVTLRLPRRRI